MKEEKWLRQSERYLRVLLRLYPTDFRDEFGSALIEAYRDRCRTAVRRGGLAALGWVWLRALIDSLRNGVGERLRPAVGWRRTGNWGRDTELVVRRLARAPLFTVTVVCTLTVGLGAFAVVYTAVDKVLIEPLPYERPDDLYYIWRDYGPIFDLNRGWLGGTDVAELQSEDGVIEDAVGIYNRTGVLSGEADAGPEQITVMEASPGLFELLGVEPMLGRGFAPDEVGPGRPAVVVLGHDLWTRRFGADTAVVGSEIRLDDERFTVIGVMDRDFRYARASSLGAPQEADAYTTFDFALAETNPGAGSYAGLIRARPGSSPEAVAAAVEAVGRAIDERDFDSQGLRLYAVGAKDDLIARVRPALIVLGVAGGFLVLVLAVNLATLLLARAAGREREFAVSRALGANPVALGRATVLEGVVLGALGGGLAVLAALWGTQALVGLAPLDLPRRYAIEVGWDVAAIVIGVGALVGLLAGALPALRAMRTRLSALLVNTAVRGGGGHGRMRRGMVVVQIALSLVLLSAGGLVVRSFEQLLRAEPGFRSEGVLTLRVFAPESRYPGGDELTPMYERVRDELSTMPGVTAASAVSALPLSASASQNTITMPGAPGNTGDPERDEPLVDRFVTLPGYFEALGITLLAGRGFRPVGVEGQQEVIIDRRLAERFYPTGDPLGATLMFGPDSLTVVGVADHARTYDVHEDGRPQIYLRYDYYPLRALSFAVRTDLPPGQIASAGRAAVHRVDRELAVSQLRSMDEIVSASLRQQRLSAVLISGFSFGALLLAAMGLFGVVAGAVARRRHELAVRMALGADHGRVLRFVLREGAGLVLVGLLIGAPGVYLAGRGLRGVLVGVSPFDPLTLAAVATGLALVALVACYLPARRVTRIEPARSLREE